MISNRWDEYFKDPNVSFPEKPCLLESIDVYPSPNGMGLIFTGGVEKFIVKGKTSYVYYEFLKIHLNGTHSLHEILNLAYDKGYSVNEMASLIKILHSYHVIVSFQTNTINSRENRYDANALHYYERVIGITGENSTPTEVLSKLEKSKTLFITTSKLLPILYHLLKINHFGQIGFIYIESPEHLSSELSYIKQDEKVVHFESLVNEDSSLCKNTLSQIMDHYTHINFVCLESKLSFIQEITQLCVLKKRNLFYFNEFDHEFEIGPYYFFNDTSCYNCFQLRKQSYKDNAYIDYIDQMDVSKKINLKVKGYDLGHLSLALNYFVIELKKIITNYSKPATINKVLLINPLDATTSYVPVERVPGCPICNLSHL